MVVLMDSLTSTTLNNITAVTERKVYNPPKTQGGLFTLDMNQLMIDFQDKTWKHEKRSDA